MNVKFRCEFISWSRFYSLSRKLCYRIHDAGFKPDIIIAIGRGGFMPARIISDFLDIMNQPFDNIWYNGATVGNVAGAPLVTQPHRLDKILILGMQNTYEILKGLEFGVHWYYIRDRSNISLYNYSRHIVGCQFNYRY